MEIHEFSTGINPQRTPDGGWVSKGFTGEYMNKTLSTIPPVVQDAIANREFAVAEGGYGSDPAIIGREVSGWSVVAIVTKGKDDRGRSASMYRYFLTEKQGHLGLILAWMDEEKRHGRKLVFDPFNSHRGGKFEENSIRQTRENFTGSILETIPAIVPYREFCTPSGLNQIATQMAEKNGRAIAWAFKVEALEQPRIFQVIYPGSDRSEQLLHRTLASQNRFTAPVAGEQNLKNAVKGLMRKVKPDSLQTLNNALMNSEIEEGFWHGVFDGQGASNAISQGLYSDQMVRLLTLRAIVFPETLPKFLEWMESRSGKQDDHWTICARFQREILNESNQLLQLDGFRERVLMGVRSLIPRVVQKPELISSVAWLLASSQGIWGCWYKQQVRGEIDEDLSSMKASVRDRKDVDFHLAESDRWHRIYADIKSYWNRYPAPLKKYRSLAELFTELRDAKIAALFYHISSGVVPKKIFFQLQPSGFNCKIYEIRIEREIGFFEFLWIGITKLGGIIVPFPVVIVLMMTMLFGGFFTGVKVTEGRQSGEIESGSSVEQKTPQTNSKTEDTQEEKTENTDRNNTNEITSRTLMPFSILEDADKQFEETIYNLESIMFEVQNESKKEKHEIVFFLEDVLSEDNNLELNYENIKDSNNANQTEKNNWIEAIYLYQQKKEDLKKNPVGYILSGKEGKKFSPTGYSLYFDVLKKIKDGQTSSNPPI